MLARLAPLEGLAEESESARIVRGVSLAVAQHWLLVLPDGELKELAIEQIATATDTACKALN